MGQFIFPLVGLGKLAPDAALERGDVEVGRWIDDSACARDRLLDDELAALEAAGDERGERRLGALSLLGCQLARLAVRIRLRRLMPGLSAGSVYRRQLLPVVPDGT